MFSYVRDCYINPEGYYPNKINIEKIIALYFDIYMDLVDKEREIILKYIQNKEM